MVDPTRPTVVADVDTGIDDALALLWLAAQHRSGRLDLHVTTAAGNTTAALAARNSTEVLRIAGCPGVPVTPGATQPRVLPLTTTPETHGPEGLGYWRPRSGDLPAPTAPSSPADAVAAWEAAAPTRLLVAGPATNLAYAVEHAPELLVGTRVTLMCGAFTYPGNTTPTAEWNAWVDPHALSFALEHWPAGAEPPTICPLNVTERVLLTPERLAGWTAALRPTHPEQADLLEGILRFYFEFHESVGVGYVAQIHDLAAAMVLCGAVDAELTEATVRVEADSELLRGTTVADWTGRTAQGSGDAATAAAGAAGVGPYWGRPANARVLTGLEPAQVFGRFGESIA